MTKNESDQQLVIFKLDNEYYGIEISRVQEVIKCKTITPLPKTPKFLRGIINLRSKIISVLDVRNLFNISPAGETKQSRIIVVSINNMTVGLVVDSVNEVVHLPDNVVESPKLLASRTLRQDMIEGIGRLENRLILLLAVDKLIENIDMNALIYDKQKVA